MGSKARIAKDIVPIIQKHIDENNIHCYIEPFCGGCNIIDKIKCDKKFAYDLNKYLIHLLSYVQKGGRLYDDVDKEMYDEARKAYYNNDNSRYMKWEIGCIGFLASWGGRYFDGGYAKPKWSQTKDKLVYRHYYAEAKRNIEKQASTSGFKDIVFGISDYRDLKLEEEKNFKCVIYADPPYKNTKTYGNSKNFDYDEFWEIMRKWSENHIVIISEKEAPSDFECIWEGKRRMTLKKDDNSRIMVERLFKWKGNNES